MKDGETLDAHNVQDGYTIHMVLRARSNAPAGSTSTSGNTSQTSGNVTPPPPPNKSKISQLGYVPGTTPSSLDNLNMRLPDPFSFDNLSYLNTLRTNLSGNGLSNLNINDFRQHIEQEIVQNPEMLRQIVNNPLVQGIMSDPENIRMFVTSNPQMRELIDVSCDIRG